ncbi:hypothetical protein CCMSSC00406_0008725 [Pleurotus cornucopiae]|uniref:Uncharacterized protein n=1 Tax=Pleurotus cornucopiae TaxID=5321 RepID=A0ACB7J9J5_PLECO|nr:hypothetical protein CCMSSC00406_0008725 [Pleurotus cornucopiae]
MARLISSRVLPVGNSEWEEEARKIRWASDLRIVKISNFVTAYTSRSFFTQLLLVGVAAAEITTHDKEVQQLLDRFEVHERRRPNTIPRPDPQSYDAPPSEIPARPSQLTNPQQVGHPWTKKMVIIHNQTVHVDGNQTMTTVDGFGNGASVVNRQGKAVYNYIN